MDSKEMEVTENQSMLTITVENGLEISEKVPNSKEIEATENKWMPAVTVDNGLETFEKVPNFKETDATENQGMPTEDMPVLTVDNGLETSEKVLNCTEMEATENQGILATSMPIGTIDTCLETSEKVPNSNEAEATENQGMLTEVGPTIIFDNGLKTSEIFSNCNGSEAESSDSELSDMSFDNFSSSSTSSYVSSDDEDKTNKKKPASQKCRLKTKGELDLVDLPKLQDLTISVKVDDLQLMGSVTSIVDLLVVVHSLKDSKPLDMDTVLFFEDGSPLGQIFDVFGPVVHPFYVLRFNSPTEIEEKHITKDTKVYFAPENEAATSFVFVSDLKQVKGSDASWTDNNEPPENCLDYSDDEQEKQAKRKQRAKNRNISQETPINIEPIKRCNVSYVTESRAQNPTGNYGTPSIPVANVRPFAFKSPVMDFNRMRYANNGWRPNFPVSCVPPSPPPVVMPPYCAPPMNPLPPSFFLSVPPPPLFMPIPSHANIYQPPHIPPPPLWGQYPLFRP